ncbi:MAG: cytochrome c peroxidase, partial [Verrucomicrobiota bacterium]|nr:cytochrome c peroxidase [Verrucomicrobiota bacterium]
MSEFIRQFSKKSALIAHCVRGRGFAGGFLWMALVVACQVGCVAESAGNYFEGRQTHPIAITPNGQRLLALNTPEGRLSVFDISSHSTSNGVRVILTDEIRVGLEPVSVAARTDDEIWVVNEVSDSVSIISLRKRGIIETLACPDEPSDIAFAQGKAFVTCARNGMLRVFDVETRREVGTIPLKGEYPRTIAVHPKGGSVFVTFHLSGNQTTILPANLAPAPPPPSNPALAPAPKTGLIVPVSDPRVKFKVLDHDVAEVSVSELRVVNYFSGVGTVLFDAAIRPGTEELWVANTEALNLIRFEPELKGHFIDNRITQLNLTNGAAHIRDLNGGIDYGLLPNEEALATSLAQPSAIVFASDGTHGWVAGFGSDRIAKISAEGEFLLRVDLRILAGDDLSIGTRRMRGPRGFALDEGRGRLFVLNKLANSITVVNGDRGVVEAEFPVGTHDPMAASVKEGRGFLFDARLSGNGTVSCASCHIDADRDGLSWDLGDPGGHMITVTGRNLAAHDPRPRAREMHPMKGPMLTQTLRGLAKNQLLHWRGDRATLHDFNATYRDLMGGSLVEDGDIESLQEYLDTLRHHPNPNRGLDNSMGTLNGGDPNRGRTLFTTHVNHCGVCHVLPTGTDNNIDDLRNLAESQPMKTPPMQTVYQRALLDTREGATNTTGFGMLHDGSGGKQGLPTVHFYELDSLGGKDFADVAAFVLSFETGIVPAVGFNRTVTAANRGDEEVLRLLGIVEAQAGADLIAVGSINGLKRQFLYDKSALKYLPDNSGESSLTRSELLGMMGSSDSLTFFGTPAGEGRRVIDRN